MSTPINDGRVAGLAGGRRYLRDQNGLIVMTPWFDTYQPRRKAAR